MRLKESRTCKVFMWISFDAKSIEIYKRCRIFSSHYPKEALLTGRPATSLGHDKSFSPLMCIVSYMCEHCEQTHMCGWVSTCVHVRSKHYLRYHPQVLCDSPWGHWSGAHQPGWAGCLVSPRHLPVSASPACHHAWHFYAGAGGKIDFSHL